MQVLDQQGSSSTPASAQTHQLHLLVNFCRTVVRSDNKLLQDAIFQYSHFLATQGRG